MEAKRFSEARRATVFGVALAVLGFQALTESPCFAKAHQFRERTQTEIEKIWGVKSLGIRLTAGGFMLDFRYEVRNPKKAQPLFARQAKPYLIDEASGAQFIVPTPAKVGPLRSSSPPLADRHYFILFANPGRFVKAGNLVSVVIGDFKVEHLKVE